MFWYLGYFENDHCQICLTREQFFLWITLLDVDPNFYRWDLKNLFWFCFYNNLKLSKNGNSRKCQSFDIFVIAEIHKIDLEALLFRILKISIVKILILR